MKNKQNMLIVGVISLSLVACASVPPTEELIQLNGEELKTRLVGNTWTSKYHWGTWAEYHIDENTGLAKAWGNWGTEEATLTYNINDDGEGCWSYQGDPEWADPEYRACSVVLVDLKGNFYSKSTENKRKPERVGKLRKIKIKPGDAYGLADE